MAQSSSQRTRASDAAAGVDCLSALPRRSPHTVMSFLPARQTVQTADKLAVATVARALAVHALPRH